jgi:hypothetical protein
MNQYNLEEPGAVVKIKADIQRSELDHYESELEHYEKNMQSLDKYVLKYTVQALNETDFEKLIDLRLKLKKAISAVRTAGHRDKFEFIFQQHLGTQLKQNRKLSLRSFIDALEVVKLKIRSFSKKISNSDRVSPIIANTDPIVNTEPIIVNAIQSSDEVELQELTKTIILGIDNIVTEIPQEQLTNESIVKSALAYGWKPGSGRFLNDVKRFSSIDNITQVNKPVKIGWNRFASNHNQRLEAVLSFFKLREGKLDQFKLAQKCEKEYQSNLKKQKQTLEDSINQKRQSIKRTTS